MYCHFTTQHRPVAATLLAVSMLVAVGMFAQTAASQASGPSPSPTPTGVPTSGANCLPGPGQTPVVPCSGGGTVSYGAGWNLVGGPDGSVISDADGPLYTLAPGDHSYETVSPATPLTPGQGYWAYFSNPVTEYFPRGNPRPTPVSFAASAGQFIMIGDPYPTDVTVSGADLVYTYDPQHGYQLTTTLHAGQGALAVSAAGGTITISPP